MEKELEKMYQSAIKQLNATKDGTELSGYWLGKASAILEFKSLISKEN